MATKKSSKTAENTKDQELISWLRSCKDEADQAKTSRMHQNKQNFDLYHLRHDFSHKKRGQSREVLSKQAMATETIASFFQQALADVGDWWKAEASNPLKDEVMPIRPHEIQLLTNRHLERAGLFSHVGQAMKSGLLGGLIITKLHGCRVPKPKFVAKTKKDKKGQASKVLEKVEDFFWQLKLDLVRQENYYPDPTGEGLYEIEEMWMDLHQVKKLSEGEYAIYDKSAVDQLAGQMGTDWEDQYSKNRETDQDFSEHSHRSRVKLTEFWGTVLDRQGNILHENIVMTLANDKYLIRPPTPNPNWHQKSPYVAVPILEVPHAVWPKALMDAPSMHNIALNEIYNLIVDGAMKSVHGISQIRVDWLDDVSQISDGLAPGDALRANGQCPPGAKVAEPVITSSVPGDGLNVFNLMNQEFNASALTNDLRQGVMPFRAVKATEVVEASQTITSIFQGIAKNIEQKWITRLLDLAWATIAQNMDDLYEEEIQTMFGEARAKELAALSPQDRFAQTVNGLKFRVFGVTMQLNRAGNFQKYTTLLQTIGSSEILIEEFTKKYDFGRLLEEVMTSLNLDKYKLERPKVEQELMQPQSEAPLEEGATQPGTTPDEMSQIPQAAGMSLEDLLGGAGIPRTQFPGSPATAGEAQ